MIEARTIEFLLEGLVELTLPNFKFAFAIMPFKKVIYNNWGLLKNY